MRLSDLLLDVHDNVAAVRQELSTQQTIRETQSTIVTQQTIMTTTAQNTMMQLTRHAQTMQETVQTAASEFAAQKDEMARMLARVLEQLS
jgi:hypothetical protein